MRVLDSVLGSLLLIAPSSLVVAQQVPRFYQHLARETLAPKDGWGSFGSGTTGGSAAAADHVFVVSDRNQLATALSGADPKIVFVQGAVYGNVDAAGKPLSCEDYAAGTGYTLEAYLAAFDPAVWGRTQVPSGPLETARKAAAANQQQRVVISLPSNTTLIGLGDARIVGAHVSVHGVHNVIIRNLRIEDAFDCFPRWDPTDGSQGNWNAAYDNVSLAGAANVWVDHCELSDGDHPDSAQPSYLGRPYVQHDGELDITDASDLITVSWNHFFEHDKVMLIGRSDKARADAGKLRITVHHNYFDSSVQRTPRVRYGQVHVFNNYYLANPDNYVYSWGVGVQSQMYAEKNFFETKRQVPSSKFINRYGGTNIFVRDTLVDGHSRTDHVDILAAYNATHSPALIDSVSWVPTLFVRIHPTQKIAGLVRNNAGVFKGRQANRTGAGAASAAPR